ncbi:TIGR02186 family protein [Bartonella sp. HY406]|uniref:TIGR02186 family protein n=1 Tax=Bartonella sp. HY406 TaxID=2979331 RepID=UPI0021C5B3A7|nr:TIGR02186 family protein [Bartonella sp. HY406]UXN03642.1 TIGR02186 family protein [Bartonella sp. HY406]
MKNLFPYLLNKIAVCVLATMVVAANAQAQDATSTAPVATQIPEQVQIIVTTDTITIGTNFTGTDLYIAGVVQHADPLVARQNRYNIIVTLEGPAREMTMRQKKRRLGVWVNADALTFKSVPLYYNLGATSELRDITAPQTYRDLGLSIDYMPLQSDSLDQEKVHQFREQLIALKKKQHLYTENPGTVMLDPSSLFKARFELPANLPVGNYQIKAYLFRDGAYVSHAETRMDIMKAHFAYSIYHLAHAHAWLYGLLAVFIAIFTGFAGRFILRKD